MADEKISKSESQIKTKLIAQGTETILLSEDEEAIRELIRRTLSQRGYKIIEARHGREALEMSQSYNGEIHLLISDVVMPHMSGIELTNHIVKLRPQIKILLMSGHTEEAITPHGNLDPEKAFLQKPFLLDSLIHKVREVLDEKIEIT